MDTQRMSIKQREQLQGYINDEKISQLQSNQKKSYISNLFSFIKSYISF